jgi:GntR family transcriptional regulator/MocR family aminotransferase
MLQGDHIKPKNVISTRSTEMSLYIISQLLIRQKMWFVWDLSHYAANMIFQQSGAIIKTIPIDEQGLDVDYIKTHFVKGNSLCLYLC